MRDFPIMASHVDVSELTAAERLALIDELWSSLSDDAALPMSPSLGHELDSRVRRARQEPESGRTWESIRSDLEGAGSE